MSHSRKRKPATRRAISYRAARQCKHMWRYFGGEAKCIYCGKYVQPDGRITSRP